MVVVHIEVVVGIEEEVDERADAKLPRSQVAVVVDDKVAVLEEVVRNRS